MHREIDSNGIIFDIDGVLEFQGSVYEGAVETVSALRKRGITLRFLTNSTLKSRKSCAEKLQRKGFYITEEEVITASYATAVYLREIQPRSCWVLLEREGRHEFDEFVHDTENPEYIVIGDCRDNFRFETLNKALRLLVNGARLIGMSPELIDSSMREIELNVGSWVHMLELASGVEAIYIGKPNRYVFDLTLRGMDCDNDEVIMVGDRIDSDIQGAKNAGMRSILVKTGEFREADLTSGIEPDFIVDSLDEIRELIR
jgi:HAD superfamily hydrolase (TIGR01458 family)